MLLYRTGPGTDQSQWKIVQIADKDEDNFVCECETPELAQLIVSCVNTIDYLAPFDPRLLSKANLMNAWKRVRSANKGEIV